MGLQHDPLFSGRHRWYTITKAGQRADGLRHRAEHTIVTIQPADQHFECGGRFASNAENHSPQKDDGGKGTKFDPKNLFKELMMKNKRFLCKKIAFGDNSSAIFAAPLLCFRRKQGGTGNYIISYAGTKSATRRASGASFSPQKFFPETFISRYKTARRFVRANRCRCGVR